MDILERENQRETSSSKRLDYLTFYGVNSITFQVSLNYISQLLIVLFPNRIIEIKMEQYKNIETNLSFLIYTLIILLISLLIILRLINQHLAQMGNERMNDFLRNRKLKHKKVASYRKQRIIKHYRKLQDPSNDKAPDVQAEPQDEGTRRRLEFYQSTFTKSQEQKQQKPKIKPQQVVVVDQSEQKLEKLKEKKKKYIKKMQNQKTNKGQPVMRNYVKYALAKLEETLLQEKKAKK